MATKLSDFLSYVTDDNEDPGNKEFVGIGGFTLYVAISETINYSSDIPDFVAEDLSTVQDTIIVRPRTLTITGQTADIFIETKNDDGIISSIEEILNIGGIYLPDRTNSQIDKIRDVADRVKNAIGQFENVNEDIRDIVGIVTGEQESSNIKQAFLDKIQQLWSTKTIFEVDLSYKTFEKVAITGFSYTQTNDGDTGDFTITCKEVRISDLDLFRNNLNLTDAQKAKVKVNKSLDGQLDSNVNKGISEGITVLKDKALGILDAVTTKTTEIGEIFK